MNILYRMRWPPLRANNLPIQANDALGLSHHQRLFPELHGFREHGVLEGVKAKSLVKLPRKPEMSTHIYQIKFLFLQPGRWWA